MSGDNPITVAAIARSLNLPGEAIDASARCADDAALAEALATSDIFGRVSPEQKRTAVGLLREQGHTVAMTGDGVNDAMAIKDANLGIAMGTAHRGHRRPWRGWCCSTTGSTGCPNVLAFGRSVIANVERVANLFLAKTVYGILFAAHQSPCCCGRSRSSRDSSRSCRPWPSASRRSSSRSRPTGGIYKPGVLKRILRYVDPRRA